MQDKIETSAEAAEADALPRCYEVHANSEAASGTQPLPGQLQKPVESKSPAQWAYERLILYIQNFEKTLDGDHEVAMGFTGGDAGVMRIQGMGYFDPDIITFFGSDGTGARTQLVQHVSQLNVMLRALPKSVEDKPANRIGFRLAAEYEDS